MKVLSIPKNADLDLNKNDINVQEPGFLRDCTAPIWDNAWSPLFLSSRDSHPGEVWSSSRSRYYLENDGLYRDDEKILYIEPRSFDLRETTLYDGYDDGYYIRFNDDKTFSILDDNGEIFTSAVLFNQGQFLHARIKVVNNTPIAVVLYITDEGEKRVVYYRNGKVSNFRWQGYRAVAAANSFSINAVNEDLQDPLIWIGYNENTDSYGVTIFNLHGSSINPWKDLAWMTLVDHNEYVFYNNNFTTGSQTVKQDVTEVKSWKITYRYEQETKPNEVALYKDGGYYRYIDDTTVPTEEITFDIGYNPSDTGNTIDIGGETYNIYFYSLYEYTYTWNLSDDSGDLRVADAEYISKNTSRIVEKYNLPKSYDIERYLGKRAVVTYRDISVDIPSASWQYGLDHPGYSISHTYEYSTTVTKTNRGAPTLFGEDGYLYGAVTIADNTTINANVVWSFKASIKSITTSTTAHTISFESTDYYEAPTNYRTFKGCSVDIAQGYIRYNALFSGTVSGSTRYYSIFFDSALDKVYYGTGMQVSDIKYDVNNLPFTSFGSIVDIGGGFRILINAGYSQGISYGERGYQGTLLTEWGNLDTNFYIGKSSKGVVYRDSSGRDFRISIVEQKKNLEILFDRYIVINTTDYNNCFDIKLGKPTHYAGDWNNRAIPGKSIYNITTLASYLAAINQADYYLYTSGINSNYAVSNTGIVSLSIGPSAYIYQDHDTITTLLYGNIPNDSYPVDIYFGKDGAIYQYTVINNNSIFVKSNLIGLPFPIASNASSYFTPNIFTRYIKSYNNKDMVLSGDYSYLLNYIYGTTPTFSWSTSSQQGSVDSIFVIQGQFYGVIDNKLYALVYSDQVLVSAEAIIDTTGLKYLGFIPTMAYFYSPVTKALYSFTGDANLTLLKECTKWDEVKNSWFSTSTQTLYIATDSGTYVFSPSTTYRIPFIFESMFFTNDGHIIGVDGSKSYDFTYYKTEESTDVLDIELETQLIGAGSQQINNITKWLLTLRDTGYSRPVVFRDTLLTDSIYRGRDHEVAPSFKNGVAHVEFCPELQKGQGAAVYIKSPYIIQDISFEIGDSSGKTTSSNRNKI